MLDEISLPEKCANTHALTHTSGCVHTQSGTRIMLLASSAGLGMIKLPDVTRKREKVEERM